MGGEGPRGRALSVDPLSLVLSAPPPVSVDGPIAFLSACAEEGSAFEAAVRGGALADRLGYAFVAGYEAALSALLPSRDRARAAALCATEAGGAHPRAIATTIAGGALNGEKTFVTLGEHAEALYVLAREAGERDAEGRPRLVLVCVDRSASGVAITPLPPAPFVPEIPHAKVSFTEVRAFERLPGDGWADYVRPFRTVEDLHVHAALVGWLAAIAVRNDWPREAIARAAAVLLSLRELSTRDPSSPLTHLALAGVIDLARALVRDLEPAWRSAGEEERARWERDRPLLDVAGKARAARLERAWERIAALRKRV